MTGRKPLQWLKQKNRMLKQKYLFQLDKFFIQSRCKMGPAPHFIVYCIQHPQTESFPFRHLFFLMKVYSRVAKPTLNEIISYFDAKITVFLQIILNNHQVCMSKLYILSDFQRFCSQIIYFMTFQPNQLLSWVKFSS